MARNDILQYKGQLKKPYIRRWYDGKGEDTYRQAPATKKKFSTLLKSDIKLRNKYYIAYKGKEYGVKEFVKKYPKLALLKKEIKKKIK